MRPEVALRPVSVGVYLASLRVQATTTNQENVMTPRELTAPNALPAPQRRATIRHAGWLWLLLALFCFRVAAQLIQTQAPVRWLPDFESWHSAVLPYPILFSAQLAIIGFYAWIAWRVSTGRLNASARAGKVWTTLAVIYALVMFVRLLLGVSDPTAARWFHSYISIAFHFVLAGFLYVVGLHHRR